MYCRRETVLDILDEQPEDRIVASSGSSEQHTTLRWISDDKDGFNRIVRSVTVVCNALQCQSVDDIRGTFIRFFLMRCLVVNSFLMF